MVVGFTSNYAISAFHHYCCEFESCLWISERLIVNLKNDLKIKMITSTPKILFVFMLREF